MTADGLEAVLVDRDHGVAVITLNRPEKLNALTPVMQHRYVELLHELDADPDVRAIVVTGAGRGFCSGADLAALADTEQLLSYAPDPTKLPTVALQIRKPLVAAVNGPVAGIGFALMMSCDVRFLAAGTRIGTSFARLGLVAEYGLSWLLPRVIGTGRALELLMSGRQVDSDEALRLGLVQEVVDADDVVGRAVGWARDVAEHCSPRSLAVIKRQVYGDLERPLDESIDRALALMVESFGWGGLQEALSARSAGRDPQFAALGADD